MPSATDFEVTNSWGWNEALCKFYRRRCHRPRRSV